MIDVSWMCFSFLTLLSGDFYRCLYAPFHAMIGSAPADDVIHGIHNLSRIRVFVLCEQAGNLHHHARLAVTALDNLLLDPGPFDRMILRKPFNGRDVGPLGVFSRNLARSFGLTFNKNRARSALTNTAGLLS
jgi:hypothetical protein